MAPCWPASVSAEWRRPWMVRSGRPASFAGDVVPVEEVAGAHVVLALAGEQESVGAWCRVREEVCAQEREERGREVDDARPSWRSSADR